MEVILALASVVIAIGSLWQLSRNPAVDGRYWLQVARAAGAFLVLMIAGTLVFRGLWTPDYSRQRFYLMLGFIVLWFLLGVVWVIRLSPYLDGKPGAWLMRPWTLVDAVLLLGAGITALAASQS